MIDFDYVLSNIGRFGRYQIVVSVVLSYCAIINGMNEYASIFLAYYPDYRCRVPPFENSTEYANLTEEQILNLTTPTDPSGEVIDPCVRYGYNLSECSNSDFTCVNKSAETIACDMGYRYDDSLFANTIVTEFDLVCDREALGYASTSAYLAGNLIGALSFAHLTDRIGRRPVMFITNAGLLVSALATSFCHHIAWYSVGRFFQAFFGCACYGAAYVHVIEIVGINWRGMVGIGFQMFYVIGYMLWSGIAYEWRDWHQLQFAVFVVQLPFTIACVVVPESARWLFVRKREDQGKKVSRTMARWNERDISEELWTDADITVIESQEPPDTKVQAIYSMLDLFRSPGIRKTTIKCCFLSFVFGLVYYGVSLNLGSVGGNLFLNNLFGIAGIFEFASYLVCGLILNYTGRRPLISFLLTACGVCLATYVAITELAADNHSVTIATSALVQIGKACIGGSFAVGVNFLAELFPTIIRNSSSAFISVVGQIGAIIGPAFILLQNDIPWLPNCIFALLSVFGGLVTMSLPETSGLDLTETIEEAELFYAGKPYRRQQTTASESSNGDAITMENPYTKSTPL